MKSEFLFLTVLIPGPSDPRHKIDVYLQPLIDDLCTLWNDGIPTFDVSLKQNFLMKVALIWTINDFPDYGMLSGWTNVGKLGCPICMERSKSFTTLNFNKVFYFDCHRQFLLLNHAYRRSKKSYKKGRVETSPPPPRLSSLDVGNKVAYLLLCLKSQEEKDFPGYGVEHNWKKQSIFWLLPYWKTQLWCHNIDVVHTKRKVFMNVFNIMMDINGKNKDTHNARINLAKICILIFAIDEIGRAHV